MIYAALFFFLLNCVTINQWLLKQTLEDTLGFTPKVDFNAGVVAAGEAQIESTVTGNASPLVTSDPSAALRDRQQVFLPTNVSNLPDSKPKETIE